MESFCLGLFIFKLDESHTNKSIIIVDSAFLRDFIESFCQLKLKKALKKVCDFNKFCEAE